MSRKHTLLMLRPGYWLFLISAAAQAQDAAYRTGRLDLPVRAQVTVSEIKEDWFPALQNLEADPYTGKETLKQIKADGRTKYAGRRAAAVFPGIDSLRPILLRNFQGNNYNARVPNDNDLAVSNAGKLVSVINSTICIFDVEKDTLEKVYSLSAFSASLGYPSAKYDPRVVYDPLSDRFIIVYLNGFTDADSRIILAFSQTNDPLGGWNLYAIEGNPKINGTWSDYPMIAVSTHELFITVNALLTGASWQSGFVETVIWQVGKQGGYLGDTLSAKYYDSILYNGNPVRNLCPVKGGSSPYGPGMYLLSNRNFAAENDTVFLLGIPDTAGSPSVLLTVQALITTPSYGVPPDARQAPPHSFATNDARILGAFLENDRVQYVQNTVDTSTGFSAVYHGIIVSPGSMPSCSGNILGDTALDFGYPAISYTGKIAADNESIITFNHTSPSAYSGCSAIFFGNDGRYSSRLPVKDGAGYVDLMTDTLERWGDYSGSQTKYNEPGKAWVVGSFGTAANQSTTWVAELKSIDSVRIPEDTLEIPSSFSQLLYPNPAAGSTVTAEFNMPANDMLSVTLYDARGRLVKELYKDMAYAGKNRFSFSVAPLLKGTYILVVRQSGDGKMLSRQKIVVL